MTHTIDHKQPPPKRKAWRWLATLLAIGLLLLASTLGVDGFNSVPGQMTRVIAREEAPRPRMAPPPVGLQGPANYLAPHLDLSHLAEQRLAPPAAAQSLPSTFDWRDLDGKSYVTPARDQGTCAACYAFAFLGQLESKLLIDGAGSVDLSENHAKECNWKERNGFEFPAGYPWGSCDGGNSFMLANLYSQAGTVLESCDPYAAGDVACNDSCQYQQTVVDWRIISTGPAPRPEVLKQYLYEQGPLAVSMFIDMDQGFNPDYDGSYTLDYVAPADRANHTVLLVGWSDRLPPRHGGAEPAQGWIVRNNWGPDWGDSGYFYITYGAANLGAVSSFVDQWLDRDDAGELWYFDEGGWWQSWGCEDSTAYALARFVAPQDAGIARVELWTTDATTDLDVYLFDDFDGDLPDGLLASKLDNHFDEAGYHSIALDAPLWLSGGEDVFVVVKATNLGYGYPFAGDPHGPLAPGHTYLSCEGKWWHDMGADYGADLGIRLRTHSQARAAPAPVVTSVSPPEASNDGVLHVTDLAGAHFQPGASVTLTRDFEADLRATNVAVMGSDRITCDLNLVGAAPGDWDVVVTNPNGRSAILPAGFSVASPVAPRVTGISPSQGAKGDTVRGSNLAGSGFQPGATVRLARDGQAGIPATNVIVISESQIACDLDLDRADTGDWDIVVTNANGQSGTLSGGFSIAAPAAPQAMSITPGSGANLGPVRVSLAGVSFQAGASVRLVRARQPEIQATNVVVASASLIQCDLDLSGAINGAWDVIVTNPDGRGATLANGFAVTSAEKVWNGSASADWHTAANWTPSGVPALHQNVAILDVANDPVISRDDAAVHDLTLDEGAVLDISLRTLSVEGTVTNNGTLRQSRSVPPGRTTGFLYLTDLAGKRVKYYGLEMSPDGESSAEAGPAHADNPAQAVALGSQASYSRRWNWDDSYLTDLLKGWYNGAAAGQGAVLQGRLATGSGSGWPVVGAKESLYTPHLTVDLSPSNTTASIMTIPGQVSGPNRSAGDNALVTVSISGNQLCARRTSGVRRCYDVESDRPIEASVRFYFREAERNGTNLDDLRAYHFGGSWSRVSSTHGSGDKDASEGLYVRVRSLNTPSRFALDGLDVESSVIYLPAVRNRWP